MDIALEEEVDHHMVGDRQVHHQAHRHVIIAQNACIVLVIDNCLTSDKEIYYSARDNLWSKLQEKQVNRFVYNATLTKEVKRMKYIVKPEVEFKEGY